ncbi:MAG: outer membrane protein assembly factor BamA [Tidjanibacter sp.]|nr:outer membrane protein assembly factor BamA [Tidjanibacter sp.]
MYKRLFTLLMALSSLEAAFSQEVVAEAAQSAVMAADTTKTDSPKEVATVSEVTDEVEKPAEIDLKAYDALPMADYSTTPSKKYIIRRIDVSGIKYLDPDIQINSSGLLVGDEVMIPSKYLSEAIARLWSKQYFSDVRIVAQTVGDSVDLEVVLVERPRVYRWLFEGVRKGEATTLTEDLKLKRGTELSDFAIDKNIHLIKKHYTDKGYRNVDVTPRIDNDSIVRNAVNVTFVVSKNEKVRVGAIEFRGNEVFPDKRLRRAMKKVHQKSINIFQNTKLKEGELDEDFDNIIDFYNSKGYRNAIILADSVYTITPDRIGLVITVDEGNKYFYRNIRWVGNSKYSTEQLNNILGIKKGDAYDKKTLYERLGYGKEDNPEDVSTVNALYQNDGYLASQIDPTEIIIGADSIDLEIKVFEGNQYRFNNVVITGNNKVNDEVIRREIYTRPGELYNRAMIMQTMRQLASMGHFDETKIMPNIQPVSGESVDISWDLEEKNSDKFEISGGWGSGMFVGSLGVVFTNMSIGNLFNKNAWRPYPQGDNQQFSIRGQTNGTYYSSISTSFTEPWLGGRKPNSLTVGGYWSEETSNYYNYYTNSKVDNNQFFRAMGVSAGLGRRLSWPDQYFTVYNELGYQAYQTRDWSYFKIQNGWSNIITFKTVLSRSSTDSPIYPRRGSEFSLSLTLTPPYSLFDGKDYSTITDNAVKYKWIEYHKWLGSFRWFYPLTNNGDLVLMTKAEIGYLGNYNKYKQSPFEGFDVGGDGMSGYNVYGVDVISMRGYEDGTLTPSSDNYTYANVYNKYTAELRYPIIMQPQSQIFALVFAEAGNAWLSWRDYNPFQLKRSLGVGARIYLSVIGMLGIDWGYGFDKAYGSSEVSGGQFHFIIGQQF